jgi:hypothetical protein
METRPMLRSWLLAVGVSVVANVLVYWLAAQLNWVDVSIKAPNGQEIGYAAVAGSTLFASVGALLVFLGTRALFKKNYQNAYRIIALVVFLLSLTSAGQLKEASALNIFILMSLHLIVAWQMVKALVGSVVPPQR